ncbi:MAG: hypothetical protein GC134_05190 [Proteobacteria bacterium]|nr:hypothetical protein [Pseudomonadota bacterium]
MSDGFETQQQQPQEGGAPGIVVLMLGLYLIILAFFILLNAISSFDEERKKKASESVAVGFGYEADTVPMDDKEEEISLFKIYESIARDVQGTLESYLPVKDYKIELHDNQVIVRLSTPSFFEPGKYSLNPVQVEFFQDMANLLSQERIGMHLTSDLVVKGTLQDLAPDSTISVMELAGRRAAIFARALMERGVLPVTTSAGAIEDTKQEMILYINVELVNAKAAATALSRQNTR